MVNFSTRLSAAIAVLRGQTSKYKTLTAENEALAKELAAVRTTLENAEVQVEQMTALLDVAVAAVEALAAEHAPPTPNDAKPIPEEEPGHGGAHGDQPKG